MFFHTLLFQYALRYRSHLLSFFCVSRVAGVEGLLIYLIDMNARRFFSFSCGSILHRAKEKNPSPSPPSASVAAMRVPPRCRPEDTTAVGRTSGGSVLPRSCVRRQRASVGKISAKCCSFSAVSAPIFARKHAFCSIFKIYQILKLNFFCLLYTPPSPRDQRGSRMPSSA